MSTSIEDSRSRHDATGPEGGMNALLLVLGPVLVLVASTTLLALLAGLFGWHPQQMLPIAAGVGAVALLASIVTVALLFRQMGERAAAHRALQAAQSRVAGILDTAMDAIIAVDGAQRIVLFNGAAEKVFGFERGQIMGEPLERLLPERFRDGHALLMRGFGETGVTARRMGDATVLAALRANGEEFPIEASISHLTEDGGKLYTVILRDISGRRAAEERVARSEARLRGILDSAMDAIITVDDEQKVVLFNAAAELVFGWRREEAIGAPLERFIPERFRAGHADHVRRFGSTGTVTRRMGAQRIVTGQRASGEEFPIDASISQISEGGSKYYTVILRDVTERVRAQQALESSREELREFAAAAGNVREQEKSRIARELHDELGQSLTALKMDLNWMAEHLPAGQTALAGKIETMQQMLGSTVAATRRISADLRPLMLDDLGLLPALEWLVQNFTERSGIDCELNLTSANLDLPEPYATAVFRILQESLTNVARHAQASMVEATLSRAGERITLVVQDNGRGFSSSDPRRPNSFGLLGMRERAYLLGGEARVESSPGQGTRVEVSIPVLAQDAPASMEDT
jgi:PAS domain S-box-containing protein